MASGWSFPRQRDHVSSAIVDPGPAIFPDAPTLAPTDRYGVNSTTEHCPCALCTGSTSSGSQAWDTTAMQDWSTRPPGVSIDNTHTNQGQGVCNPTGAPLTAPVLAQTQFAAPGVQQQDNHAPSQPRQGLNIRMSEAEVLRRLADRYVNHTGSLSYSYPINRDIPQLRNLTETHTKYLSSTLASRPATTAYGASDMQKLDEIKGRQSAAMDECNADPRPGQLNGTSPTRVFGLNQVEQLPWRPARGPPVTWARRLVMEGGVETWPADGWRGRRKWLYHWRFDLEPWYRRIATVHFDVGVNSEALYVRGGSQMIVEVVEQHDLLHLRALRYQAAWTDNGKVLHQPTLSLLEAMTLTALLAQHATELVVLERIYYIAPRESGSASSQHDVIPKFNMSSLVNDLRRSFYRDQPDASGAFLHLVVTLTTLVARLALLSSALQYVLSVLHAESTCLLDTLHYARADNNIFFTCAARKSHAQGDTTAVPPLYGDDAEVPSALLVSTGRVVPDSDLDVSVGLCRSYGWCTSDCTVALGCQQALLAPSHGEEASHHSRRAETEKAKKAQRDEIDVIWQSKSS
ncbi:hypothetical protein EDB92DRAFT_1811970 [Lactarius akahatsu]|uniref:Uncharacterized protein n=1 Tax=Lactarius akahatsu TaxID=416441 RepID=A0AAD4LSH6_9AGAM|nr:hypothetical protein EDB92DRAFT_1811970 [Lactarius akahatsu]